jgi:hypothetical protein
MTSHRSTVVLTLAACALLSVGCGSSRQSVWEEDTTAPTTAAQNATPGAAEQRTALLAEATAAWAERGDEAKLRLAIAKWEEAVALDATNADDWATLSHAYYFLADGHLSFDEAKAEEMMATFEKGTRAAERGLLAVSPAFATRMREGARIEEVVSLFERNAVPCLYWRSANLGKWASAQGFATLVSYKDEIRAVMTRALDLDANYFYGAPHRYFGAFFARAPAYSGGDLNKSKEHFEASIAQEPRYFATRVLFAGDYAVKSQNRALFEEQLNLVINGDANALPEIAPENLVEQRKARELLARADELFE